MIRTGSDDDHKLKRKNSVQQFVRRMYRRSSQGQFSPGQDDQGDINDGDYHIKRIKERRMWLLFFALRATCAYGWLIFLVLPDPI